MALSEFAVRKAKPLEKAYKVSDSGGLFLHIQPGGSKLWRMKYHYLGKEKLLSFGAYPLVSISDARRKREEAKSLLLSGIDPSEQKKKDALANLANSQLTFGVLAEEYLERQKQKGAAPATINKTTWLLKDLGKPLWGRPAGEITPAEILALLQTIEKSGRRESARRLRGTISGVFRFAIVTLRATADPTLPLQGALLPPIVEGRAAIINESAFGKLLQSLADYDGWPTIKAALQFLILTCVRPGEVRGATRDEFDLENAVWRIPASRMKMRQPHDVPLTETALAILKDVWPLSDRGKLVFPSIRSPLRPLSENAFNAALRRMGYSKDEVTAHGFRVTASTILNSRGHDPDVIEAVLAHQDKNTIRRTYNRASYWDKRITLMKDWEQIFLKLRG